MSAARTAKERVVAATRPRRTRSALTVAGRHSPRFEVAVDTGRRLLTVAGEMDLAAVSPFTVAAASLTVGRHGDVTVDLRAVRFIDASGLGAFVALDNLLHRNGRTLTLQHVDPSIVRTFGLGGLSHLVPAVD